MDGRYYMGVDFRRDHSFRVPRPDLTISIGVPNACNNCHSDKTPQWSQDNILKWYGISRKPHYGTAFAAASAGKPSADTTLLNISKDELVPPMVRAAAISILGNDPARRTVGELKSLLGYPDPLIRLYAVRAFSPKDAQDLLETLIPLLNDPVKSIRMEAAFNLSLIVPVIHDSLQLKAIYRGIREYEQAMLYTGDFASSRHNLGSLYQNLGRMPEAEKEYRQALAIDDKFYPARVNLANVLNSVGKNEEAEKQLKKVESENPEVSGIHYSLGLLLAEMKKYDEALYFLEKAIEETPGNARIFYNYGLLLNQTGNAKEAENALLKAYSLEPGNSRFVYALSTFYLGKGNKEKALDYALILQKLNPGDESVTDYIKQLK